MFSRMVGRGGGVGLYWRVFGRKRQEVGTGNEMTTPKNATFVIHFEERRGSSVSAAPAQYPATSSGQADIIFKASSCCRASSLTFRVLRMFARILLYILPPFWFGASGSSFGPLKSESPSASRRYHPRSLKHIPTPGCVHIARRKWCTRSAGT